MDTLRGIETFVKAVETGSIAAAARVLGISAAASSQNIARLEGFLGVRLLTRTTRNLALTESGSLYFEQVRHIVRDLELARSAVTEHRNDPKGKLRIASSAAFARHVLAPRLPAFQTRFPRLAIELIATDRSVDHITESVDLSIRIREQLEDGLVAKRIASIPLLFCAAPSYLAKAGTPLIPEDLKLHDCLLFRVPADGRLLHWRFLRDGVSIETETPATMVSDDIDTLAQAAAAGGGVVRLAAFIAQRFIENGQLVELFGSDSHGGNRITAEPLDFFLCVQDRYELTPKVCLFRDYLLESLPPEWQAK